MIMKYLLYILFLGVFFIFCYWKIDLNEYCIMFKMVINSVVFFDIVVMVFIIWIWFYLDKKFYVNFFYVYVEFYINN